MLSEKALIRIATDELVRLFSKEYLKKNYQNTCQSHGIINDSLYQFFVGIKSKKDLPNREANEKGWVVYGTVFLEPSSGKIINTDYALE